GLTPGTVVGVEEFAVLPLPSRPSPLRPQQRALPSCRRAHMWKIPASMATAVVIPLTVTGVGSMRVVGGAMGAPSPSWPYVLSPQHRIVPSWSRAQVYQPPAERATAVVMPLTVTGVGLKVEGLSGAGSR